MITQNFENTILDIKALIQALLTDEEFRKTFSNDESDIILEQLVGMIVDIEHDISDVKDTLDTTLVHIYILEGLSAFIIIMIFIITYFNL
jgi:glycerol-3-phosphate responsive antiterminator